MTRHYSAQARSKPIRLPASMPEQWATVPEILSLLGFPSTKQLNLDRLHADGFIDRRMRLDGRKVYRVDQYVRWRRAKSVFDETRRRLRDENGVEKSERA